MVEAPKYDTTLRSKFADGEVSARIEVPLTKDELQFHLRAGHAVHWRDCNRGGAEDVRDYRVFDVRKGATKGSSGTLVQASHKNDIAVNNIEDMLFTVVTEQNLSADDNEMVRKYCANQKAVYIRPRPGLQIPTHVILNVRMDAFCFRFRENNYVNGHDFLIIKGTLAEAEREHMLMRAQMYIDHVNPFQVGDHVRALLSDVEGVVVERSAEATQVNGKACDIAIIKKGDYTPVGAHSILFSGV